MAQTKESIVNVSITGSVESMFLGINIWGTRFVPYVPIFTKHEKFMNKDENESWTWPN